MARPFPRSVRELVILGGFTVHVVRYEVHGLGANPTAKEGSGSIQRSSASEVTGVFAPLVVVFLEGFSFPNKSFFSWSGAI